MGMTDPDCIHELNNRNICTKCGYDMDAPDNDYFSWILRQCASCKDIHAKIYKNQPLNCEVCYFYKEFNLKKEKEKKDES